MRSSSPPVPSRDACAPGPWARASCASPRSACPDGSGIGLLHDLKTQGWARTVVISATADPYTVRAALAAGVRALVVAGRAPAAPAARPSGSEGLSAREIEVLQLVADGQSNKEIGTALGLSALTVKSHLARIARKLGTGDRAEMVALAAQRPDQLTRRPPGSATTERSGTPGGRRGHLST